MADTCSFCVLAGKDDLRTAAKMTQAHLLQTYGPGARDQCHTFQNKRTLTGNDSLSPLPQNRPDRY